MDNQGGMPAFIMPQPVYTMGQSGGAQLGGFDSIIQSLANGFMQQLHQEYFGQQGPQQGNIATPSGMPDGNAGVGAVQQGLPQAQQGGIPTALQQAMTQYGGVQQAGGAQPAGKVQNPTPPSPGILDTYQQTSKNGDMSSVFSTGTMGYGY